MRFIIFLVLFLFILVNGISQIKRDTIKTGIFLKNLYEFNTQDHFYDIDFWIWYKYKNDSLNPLKTVEIANSKKFEYSRQSMTKIGDTIWATQNCFATINQNWNLKKYPFDHQKIEVTLEEAENDSRYILLIESSPKFDFNKNINFDGWKIDSSKVIRSSNHYDTDFGDSSLNGESNYSNVVYTIYLSRNSLSLFFKLFTGCFVAFISAFFVFFIRPDYVDPRFGLSIGGLFAAVGNKYVVDSNIPETISLSLVDKIHNITFIYILITIFCSVVSLKLYESPQIFNYKIFDKISAIFLFSSYVIINIIFMVKS